MLVDNPDLMTGWQNHERFSNNFSEADFEEEEQK